MFHVAEALGVPVYKLSDMPVSEFSEWIEHFIQEGEKQKKQLKDAEDKAKANAKKPRSRKR